jgi:hypothetical protein
MVHFLFEAKPKRLSSGLRVFGRLRFPDFDSEETINVFPEVYLYSFIN